MSKQIERLPATLARLGLKRTQFRDNYIRHSDGDPWVPGTDGMVPRLRKVQLGPKAIGFFSDEIDRVIDALRRWRDRQASSPPARRSARRAQLSARGRGHA